MPAHKRPPLERFFEKVIWNGDEDECWEWQAALSRGYGSFWDGAANVTAHRWLWQHWNGPVPEGLELDHLCSNPRCVNPAHLETVTHRTNMLRGATKASRLASQTHCQKGHSLSGLNVYRTPGRPTQRNCRICARERKRAWRAKRREEGLPVTS